MDRALFDKIGQLRPDLYYGDCHSAGTLNLGLMSQYHELSDRSAKVRFEIITPGVGTVGNHFPNEEMEILLDPMRKVKCAYVKTDRNVSHSVYVSNIFHIYAR